MKNRKDQLSVLYVRVSSVDQNLDRQKITESKFDKVIEDKVSGATPFFERDGGQQIKRLVEKKAIKSLSVWAIDRLGRSLLDVLTTIEYFRKESINIEFISQGLNTIGEDGKENPIASMIISIMATIGQMERSQIKERQLEGIKIAKEQGKYLGRVNGAIESQTDFLNKPKNKKAADYLKKGYSTPEVAKLAGIHEHTVRKIKKVMSKRA